MKKSLLAASILLVGFIAAAAVRQNHEFLFYAATLVVLLGTLVAIDRRVDFTPTALWAFNTWLLLHLLGGMATIDGTRLYDWVIVAWTGPPYDILKYDQAVHVFCYFAAALLVHEALARVIAPTRRRALAVTTVLAASGIGGLNEVIEFAAVVFVGSTGVGGYTNTALDLVANLLGAIIGAAFAAMRPGPGRRTVRG